MKCFPAHLILSWRLANDIDVSGAAVRRLDVATGCDAVLAALTATLAEFTRGCLTQSNTDLACTVRPPDVSVHLCSSSSLCVRVCGVWVLPAT